MTDFVASRSEDHARDEVSVFVFVFLRGRVEWEGESFLLHPLARRASGTDVQNDGRRRDRLIRNGAADADGEI